MIDFTYLPVQHKTYAGANGKKISVLLDGERYMLKFPSKARINQDMSYANSCFSEYMGSHIFNVLGIPAQETLLGTYMVDGEEKIVVACKDFTSLGIILQDFASLKNTIIDSEHNGYGTELEDVLATIQEQHTVDTDMLMDFFWNVFVVDSLIGNWDRHNGNWGFLYNDLTDEAKIAPIFDCGSSLFPQADERWMNLILSDRSELDARIFNRPLSALKINNKKINYFDFITSLQNEDCNEALKRMVPKIDMQKIENLINETPYITDLQKDFYITMLWERKERILDKALELLYDRNRKLDDLEL